MKVKLAKIVNSKPSNGGSFVTSIHNTNISQRDKVEKTIINLATLCGASEIIRHENARGNLFYSVKGTRIMTQSASNVILDLSTKLLERSKV